MKTIPAGVYIYSYLQTSVGPVDPIVADIEIESQGLFHSRYRNRNVVVICLQGNSTDVFTSHEEQECFRDDAGPVIFHQLKAHGAGADRTGGTVEAKMAAVPVIYSATVRP